MKTIRIRHIGEDSNHLHISAVSFEPPLQPGELQVLKTAISGFAGGAVLTEMTNNESLVVSCQISYMQGINPLHIVDCAFDPFNDGLISYWP